MSEERIRILLVDDDPVDRMAFARFVKGRSLPYDWHAAHSVAEARAQLASGHFDLVISDYALGDGTCMDLLAECRETAFIVVTRTGSEETVVEAMRFGAQDHLIKDPAGHYLAVMPSTVKNVLDRREAERELRKHREHLEELVQERAAELVTEIAERRRAEEALRREFAIEDLVAEVSTRFLNYSGNEVDAGILRALGEIAAFSSVEHAYLLQASDDGSTFSMTHEWCAPGTESQSRQWQDVPMETQPWNTGVLRSGRLVQLDTLKDFPAEAQPERERHARLGIQASISAPLLGGRGGRVTGCIGFHQLSGERAWSEDDAKLLSMVAGVFANALERKRAEEERLRLEHQIQQVDKLNMAGRVAAQVGHDFNNLLTVICGQTERALLAVGEGHPAEEALRMVALAAHQSAEITRSLLTFGRVLPTEKRRLKLCDALEEIKPLVQHSLPTRVNVQFETSCERPCWIMADRTQLHQVILNLAINARDAMPHGGTFRIAVSLVDEPTGSGTPVRSARPPAFVQIRVSDTGTGMTPEVRSRLFEPFFTTKPRGGGTGLGLSIVHGVVQDHGGQISVQSKVGVGTTFTIALPLVPPEPEPDGQAAPAGNGVLILLAAADPYLRAIIGGGLRSRGYEVIHADSGSVVIETFNKRCQETRLLVLDADLPDPSCVECLQDIRERHPTLPAIILAGALELGGDPLDEHTTVIREPYSVGELVGTVADLLGPIQ